jgi:valyl-tRNA synthetase
MKKYHPTSVLETGYDIIFFWVARMVLMSTFLTGQVPFKTVYLHGMVRDERGRKLSKSLGNNIDPRDLSAKFGTDAVRMAMIVGTAPGADLHFSENKVKAYKKFANKLWNISRFVLDNTADYDVAAHTPTSADPDILQPLQALISEITPEMESFKYYLVGEKLYHYVWHTFADEIIESLKPIVQDESHPDRIKAQATLWEILTTSLKLLHPFMPFVTEEIWQSLPDCPGRDLLMVTQWPA